MKKIRIYSDFKIKEINPKEENIVLEESDINDPETTFRNTTFLNVYFSGFLGSLSQNEDKGMKGGSLLGISTSVLLWQILRVFNLLSFINNFIYENLKKEGIVLKPKTGKELNIWLDNNHIKEFLFYQKELEWNIVEKCSNMRSKIYHSFFFKTDQDKKKIGMNIKKKFNKI